MNFKIKKKHLAVLLIISLVVQSLLLNYSDTVSASSTGTVTANSLSVRTGPSTSSAHVKVSGENVYLTKGQQVQNLSTSGSFYYISFQFKGKTLKGYVHKDYIKVTSVKPTLTPTPTKKPTTTPKPTPTKKPTNGSSNNISIKGTVTTATLSIRSGAGTNYGKVGGLKKNDSVTVIGDATNGNEKWYKISALSNNKMITGYVSGYYIKLSYSKTLSAQILVSKVKISTKAGTTSYLKNKSKETISLKKGKEITIKNEVVASGSKWYQTTFQDGGSSYTGYIQASQITLKGLNKPTPTPTKKPTPIPTKKPTPTPTVDQGLSLSAFVAASKLVLRSGPGTSYNKIGELINNEVVTVVGDTTMNNEKWYGISTKQNSKTISGYASGYYIKLSYNKAINAEIIENKINVSTKAGSTSYLKNNKGNLLFLDKGKAVSIKDEAIVSSAKWFQISFELDGVNYSGYVPACKTVLQASPTPTPKPTPKPTDKPTTAPTQKPTTTAVPTVPTPVPTIKPTPTSGGTIVVPVEGTNFEVDNLTIYEKIITPTPGYICNTDFLFHVFSYNSSTKTVSFLNDASGKPIKVKSAQPVTVTKAEVLNFVPYYKIDFMQGGTKKTGYIMPSVVYIPLGTAPVPTPTKSSTNTVTPTKEPVPTLGGLSDVQFNQALAKENFPESYKDALRKLHSLYPQWVFKAYHTGLDWNTVITAENKPGLNLIPNSKGVEWLSMEEKTYKWETDIFTLYDGSYWVTVSKNGLQYYMDPRNFLTTNGIFQFELLKYQSDYQDINGVNYILNNTPFNNSFQFTNNSGYSKNYSYAQTFMKAALYSGVSPYHLASRSKQEVISSSIKFSGSASGTYSDYEGYYNFYNIGASNSAGGGAVKNALKYAKNTTSSVTNTQFMLPWTDRFRSIVGGAFWIGSRYINKGQDTVYLQKFNVTNISRYNHQYMGNVEAPYAEAKKVRTAYNSVLNTPIIFSIPVYLNMPATPVPIPAPMKNPNNRIKTLTVKKTDGVLLGLTPSFSQITKSYAISVENKVNQVVIEATAVSSKAKVSGTGTKNLVVGDNIIKVTITAEDGISQDYKINIKRK